MQAERGRFSRSEGPNQGTLRRYAGAIHTRPPKEAEHPLAEGDALRTEAGNQVASEVGVRLSC